MPEVFTYSLAKRLNNSLAKRKNYLDFEKFNVDELNITEDKKQLKLLRKINITDNASISSEDNLLKLEQFKQLMESSSSDLTKIPEHSNKFKDQYENIKNKYASMSSKNIEITAGGTETTDKPTDNPIDKPIDNPIELPNSDTSNKPTIWDQYQKIPPTIEYFNNKVNRYREGSRLKQEFTEVLKKNLEEDQKILDNYNKICNSWHQEISTKAKNFHIIEPTKDTHFLTQDNIENIKNQYQGDTYITGYEADYLCDKLKKAAVLPKNSIYDDLINCNTERRSLEKKFVQTKKELAQKEDLLNTCYQDKDGYKTSANTCYIDKNKITETVTEFKIQVEDLVNECLAENNQKENTVIDLEQKLINQKKLTEQYEIYIKNQTKIEQDLQKKIHAERHKANHAYFVLNKSEKNLGLAQDLLRECKKKKYWYKTGIANQIGIFLEVLLEMTIWPYATFNEKSLLHQILPHKLGPIQRLVLTGCISIIWVLMLMMITYKISESKQEKKRHLFSSSAFLVSRGGGLDPCFIGIKLASIRNKVIELQYIVNKPKFKPNKILQHVKFITVIVLANLQKTNSSCVVEPYELVPLSTTTTMIHENILRVTLVPNPNIEIDNIDLHKNFFDSDFKIYLPESKIFLKSASFTFENTKKPQGDLKKSSNLKAKTKKRFSSKTKKQCVKYSDFVKKFNDNSIEINPIEQKYDQIARLKSEKIRLRIDD